MLWMCASAPLLLPAQSRVMTSDAAGYLERGKLMYEARNYVGAIDQLEHVKTLPADATLIEQADYYLALSHFERGEASSLDALQAFIERYPHSALVEDAQMRVGNYYFYRGQWESALLSYSLVRDDALDLNADEDLLYRKAYCNLRLGNYNEAESQYSTLSHTRRYAAASQFYDAYLDYAAGEYPKAAAKFRAIDPNSELGYQSQYYLTQIDYHNQQYRLVVDEGTKLLAEQQNDYFDAELNRLVGESYYHLGNDTQARTYLRRYLDNPEGEPYRTAGYTMGVLDYRDGKWNDVIQDMSIVTGESDALAQSAYLYTGQARLKLNDLNGATMAFEQAAGMDYDSSVKETAFYNYAVSQSKGARTPFNRSIDMFEQFLNEYPNSRYKSDVEDYLVDAYNSTTDYQRALTSINHINKPGNKVLAAKQNVLYNLGVQALANNDNNQAASYFKQAIDVGNYNKTALNESRLWLAEAQYRSGNYKEAARNQQAYVKSASSSDDNYGIAQYNLGYSLYNQQNYTAARTAFQNAVNSKTLSADLRADAYNRIGDTQYYLRNYSAAQEAYDQAMREDKNTTGDYSMYQKGVMMGLNGKYSDEVNQMNALLKAYPKSDLAPQAMLEKGNAQALMGNSSDAIATYNTLLKAYPKSAEARKGLLQTALVNKSLNNEDAAIEAYKKVIKQYPTSDEAQAAAEDLKLLYADRGQLGDFQKFLSSVPNAPKIDVSEMDRLTFEAAEKEAIADKPSITKMQQYLEQNPNGAYTAKAKYYIARYNYVKGNYDQALTGIDEALKVGSDASFAEDALAMRSNILERQGKNAEALASYKELAQRSSSEDNRTVAQLGAMRVARNMNSWKEVQTLSSTLLERGGLTADEEKEVTLNHAMASAQLGDTKDAETSFKKLAQDPNSVSGAQAAYELAHMQYLQGNYKDAEKTVNSLIDAGTPHSYWLAKSFITLADVYYKQGKVSDARDYLQSLRNNYPGKEQEIFNEIDTRLNNWKGGSNTSTTSNASTDNSGKKNKKNKK